MSPSNPLPQPALSRVSHHLTARAGLLAVSGGALLWGTTGVAVSIVHDRSGLAAVTIGWYRVLIAAVVVAVWLRGAGVRAARTACRRHPVVIVACGVGFGAYQALYFVGVQEVGVSVSTLVSLGIAPVVSPGRRCGRAASTRHRRSRCARLRARRAGSGVAAPGRGRRPAPAAGRARLARVRASATP